MGVAAAFIATIGGILGAGGLIAVKYALKKADDELMQLKAEDEEAKRND